jgi:dipeptidase
MQKLFIVTVISLFFGVRPLFACTNLIVTKGASEDGSVFMAYTNDGEWLYRLDKSKARKHGKNDSITFYSGRNKVRGKVKQVPYTYAVLGFQMNEHQVSVGETTFTGREELWNHSKFLEYWHLMRLALERSKTAREAVLVITSLAEEYGYGSEGESFSIIDPNEAWILEMVGTGNGGEGAIWVACKIPDGYVSAHANMARIGEFPLNDPENCLYSDNVFTYAIEKGWYDANAGQSFCFHEVYNPTTPERLKYCESRVWSLFRRISPSLELKSDYHRGVYGAKAYPLWIKPDQKINLQKMFDLLRDHYEGTPYDMTKGVAAGPFGNPNRWRPLNWEIDSQKYSWERPISTYNTAFSFVAQARSFLPNEIGGLVWFGVDDTYFTCYVPHYACMKKVKGPFAIGDINQFSLESAWWVFNLVSNYTNIKYYYMIKDVQEVQRKLESDMLNKQKSLEDKLLQKKPKKMIRVLSKYSNSQAALVHEEWKELAFSLMTKYNDGYVKDNGIQSVGYPREYYEQLNELERDKYKIRKWEKDADCSKHLPF